MRAWDSRGIVLLLAAFGVAGCAAGGGEQAPPEADMEALRAEVLAAEDAMNLAVDATDCDTGARWIGEGDPLFVSNSMVVRTRAELVGMCEEMVAPRSGAVFTVDARNANMIADDAAFVVREGSYAVSFKDGTTQDMYMVMTTVWARGDDGWKMVHLHESFRPLAEDR